METTTYSVEQIVADFEDMVIKELEYIPETYGNREYYVVIIDFQEQSRGIPTSLIFLSALVKIDGTIIRTNINDEELATNGSYIANFLITLPFGTSEEFERQSGLELFGIFYERESDENIVEPQSN